MLTRDELQAISRDTYDILLTNGRCVAHYYEPATGRYCLVGAAYEAIVRRHGVVREPFDHSSDEDVSMEWHQWIMDAMCFTPYGMALSTLNDLSDTTDDHVFDLLLGHSKWDGVT